jgi:co-chaperonin GroES (HSP10)
MQYQCIRDFFIVAVDSIWESTRTKSGIITSHVPHVDKPEEVEERGEFKRRYGIVKEVPVSFSDTDVETIDPIHPQPRRYIGHDWLEYQHQRGQRGYRAHENPRAKYYPSTFEQYDVITCADIAKQTDIKEGDLVYFSHQCTDVERYMGALGDKHLFSMQVNEILCVVKKSPVFINHERYVRKTIFPQGGWVFVRINMESWEDITTPNGIIMKVAPQALPLQGKVVAAQRKDLEGKNILFEQNADAPITIEGDELTCMRQDDILATLRD